MKRSYGLMTNYESRDIAGYNLRPRKRYRSARLANGVDLAPATRVAVDREIRRIKKRDADKFSTIVVTVNNSTSDAGNVLSVLSSLTQGDGSEDNFSGEAITPISLKVRYLMDCTPTTGSGGDLYNTCRLMVVQWNSIGAASTGGAGSYLEPVGTITAPYAGKQWSNRKNFRVLFDSGPIAFQTQQFGGGNGNVLAGECYIPGFKMRKISFETDGTIQRGDIAVLCITDSAVANHPIINWTSQLIYTD